ncbi:MAG: hypothetical protein ACYTBX_18530, partial [Planctomycetota bacterium]
METRRTWGVDRVYPPTKTCALCGDIQELILVGSRDFPFWVHRGYPRTCEAITEPLGFAAKVVAMLQKVGKTSDGTGIRMIDGRPQ